MTNEPVDTPDPDEPDARADADPNRGVESAPGLGSLGGTEDVIGSDRPVAAESPVDPVDSATTATTEPTGGTETTSAPIGNADPFGLSDAGPTGFEPGGFGQGSYGPGDFGTGGPGGPGGPGGFGPTGFGGPSGPPPGTTTGGYATRFGLVRPYQGRYLAGVCAGLGRATNTDPVLWRVLLPVLTLLGGLGALIYVLGILLIPAEGDSGSPLEALAGHGRSATSRGMTIVLLVIASIAVFGGVVHFGVTLLVGAIVIGGIALLAMSRSTPPNGWPATWPTVSRTGTGFSVNWPESGPAGARTGTGTGWGTAGGVGAPSATPPGSPMPYTMSTSTAAATTGPAAVEETGWPIDEPVQDDLAAPTYQAPFAPYGPYAPTSAYPTSFPGLAPTAVVTPPPAPKPFQPRSPVRRITISAALLVVGFLGILDVTNATSVPLPMYFAAALATIGIGMFAGSFFGRVRGPITLGIILAVCLMVSAAADSLPRPFTSRTVTVAPTSVAGIPGAYTDNYGSFTLDLRKVNFTDAVTKSISINMKFGDITVLLPPNVDVVVRAHTGAGNVDLFGRAHSGVNVGTERIDDNGLDGPGGGMLNIDASLSAGDLEVSR